MYRLSLKNFRDRKILIKCAELAAVGLLLGYCPATLVACGNMKIYFSYIPAAFASLLYGPIVGAAFSLFECCLIFLVRIRTVFIPLSILNSICASLIYGMFFYERDFSFVRVFLAKLTIGLLVNIFGGLSALWPYMENQSDFAWFQAKIVENIYAFIFETILLFFAVKIYYWLKAGKKNRKKKKKKQAVYTFGSIDHSPPQF
jgi:uncharacterized membrane protein